MVHKLRKVKTDSESYTAEGGVPMMAFSLLFGGFLLVSQLI
ncbi:hypothetical protein JCM19233_1271 [Vibrio astriarenae]|nr:hypothetical protein JCM19233_1271 [Vibrio sp. C7]